jgi:hypothetical protein
MPTRMRSGMPITTTSLAAECIAFANCSTTSAWLSQGASRLQTSMY